jgi:thiol:disulfide interchange protein DsbC
VKRILASFVMSAIMAAVLASSCLAVQSETEVRQILAKTYPGIKVGEIRSSDIPGLYEIEAGSNIIYFYPEKGLLVFGEIWTRDGRRGPSSPPQN